MSDADKLTRVIRGKRLLRFLTDANVNKAFFTNEKLSKLNQPITTQNDSVYATKKGEISAERMVVKRKDFKKI